MTIVECLRAAARFSPEKEAVIYDERAIGYASLDRQSDETARKLWKCGLRSGDKIGVLMENCLESIILTFAIFKIRGIEASLVPDYSHDLLNRLIERYSIVALIHKDKDVSFLKERASKERKQTRTPPFVLSWEGLNEPGKGELSVPLRPEQEDPAVILFTSGTTAIPKGCLLSHGNFMSAALSHNEFVNVDASLRLLNILPLHHSCSKSMLFETITADGTMILEKGFTSPLRLLRVIRSQEVTHITGPPFIFHYLSKLEKNASALKELRSHLRVFEIGLSSISKRLVANLRKVFPWVSIFNRFGMTENASAASLHCLSDDFAVTPEREFSCGRGLKSTEIDLLGPDGEPARPYETGEIVIRGPNVMLGYCEEIEKGRTNDYEKDWFFTGDMGFKDEEGFVYVRGRRRDFVKVLGQRVSFAEIGEALSGIKGMSRCVPVGIPDEILGTKIVLYVTAEKGSPLDEATISNACRERLSPFARPHKIVIAESLPLLRSGKVDIRTLEEMSKG